MTKLGEEIKFNTDSSKDYFTLPVCWGVDCILANSGKNSVSFIQHHQKIVLMWTLPQRHSFTCPVVFKPEDRSIHCVIDRKIIYSWSIDSDSLKTAQQTTVPKNVFAILCVEGVLLVVFCNGHVSTFDEVVSDSDFKVEPHFDDPLEELVWSDAVSNEGRKIGTIQLTYSKKTKEYRLYQIAVEDGHVDYAASHKVSNGDAKLKCWCSDGGSNLWTIWSNGDVCYFCLKNMNMVHVLTLQDTNEKSVVAMDALSETHLAIAKLKDVNSYKGAVLEVWDVKYATRKAQCVLKHALSSKLKVKTIHSSIFLPADDGLILVPVDLESATLSAVVGKSCVRTEEELTYSWDSEGELIVTEGSDAEQSQQETNLLPNNLTAEKLFEDIVPKLGDDERSQELLSQLAELKNVPEFELVRMLRMALKAEEHSDSENKMETGCISEKQMLNCIFKISFSDIFLGPHLKILSFEEIMRAMAYLLDMFDCQLFAAKQCDHPGDMQIVKWILLLLQSHFEEVILSSDRNVIAFLKKLRLSLAEKMSVYGDIEQIDHLLQIQRKRGILPEDSVRSNYCIETLHL